MSQTMAPPTTSIVNNIKAGFIVFYRVTGSKDTTFLASALVLKLRITRIELMGIRVPFFEDKKDKKHKLDIRCDNF